MNNKDLILHFKYTLHLIDKERMIVFIDTLLTWFFNIYKARQKISLFTHIYHQVFFWTRNKKYKCF